MAMEVNFDELNPGTFFPFDEDAETPEAKKEGVTLRVLTQEKLDEIRRKTQKKLSKIAGSPPRHITYYEYKTGGEEEEFMLTWDYCIINWHGVTSKGQQIPCTTENKVKLMKGSPEFSGFILKCSTKLNQAMGLEEEELEKNLSTTQRDTFSMKGNVITAEHFMKLEKKKVSSQMSRLVKLAGLRLCGRIKKLLKHFGFA